MFEKTLVVVCLLIFICGVKQESNWLCHVFAGYRVDSDWKFAKQDVIWTEKNGSGYGYTLHDAVRIKCWVCHLSSTDVVAWQIRLTFWEPPGCSDFRKKNSSFRLPYQRPSSSAHCARELFSGSNGSASRVDCTRKKIFCLGGAFFLSDVISGGLFRHLGPLCLVLGANR